MPNSLRNAFAWLYPKSLHRRIQFWYGGLIVASFATFIGFSIHLIADKSSFESEIYMHKNAKALTQIWRRIKRLSKRPEAYIEGQDEHTRLARNQRRFKEITQRITARDYYYVIYNRLGEIARKSDSSPQDIPLPKLRKQPQHSTYQFRTRDRAVEITYRYDQDTGIVIGRDQSVDKALLKQASYPLLLLALFVIAITLLGGWFIVRKSLKPLAVIHKSTEKIAQGELRTRIQDCGIPSELTPLVTELNQTFSNLEIAINKQQRLAANASHELATPTAALLAEMESVLRRERSRDEYKDSIEHCLLAANRLNDLLKHLTALNTAQQHTEFPEEPIALKPCIEQLCSLIKPLAERKRITLSHLLDDFHTVGPVVLVEQAISSLLANAVEYTQPEGDITVTLSRLNEHAQIIINDTGIGISEEDLPHIFERYYRANNGHSAGQHSGLGLSIVKEVIETCGGTVSVKSTLGSGTQFDITLPLLKKQDSTPHNAGSPSLSEP